MEGREIRRRRLFGDGRAVVIAMDHGMFDGPIAGMEDLPATAAKINPAVDAVLLATPPHLRPELFEAAVEARKHVFMEKPVAVDGAGCRRMLAAAEGIDKEDKKARREAWRNEGIKIAIELIQQLKQIEGVAGVHIMAIEWEEAVKPIVDGAGLYPRPEPASLSTSEAETAG